MKNVTDKCETRGAVDDTALAAAYRRIGLGVCWGCVRSAGDGATVAGCSWLCPGRRMQDRARKLARRPTLRSGRLRG